MEGHHCFIVSEGQALALIELEKQANCGFNHFISAGFSIYLIITVSNHDSDAINHFLRHCN